MGERTYPTAASCVQKGGIGYTARLEEEERYGDQRNPREVDGRANDDGFRVGASLEEKRIGQTSRKGLQAIAVAILLSSCVVIYFHCSHGHADARTTLSAPLTPPEVSIAKYNIIEDATKEDNDATKEGENATFPYLQEMMKYKSLHLSSKQQLKVFSAKDQILSSISGREEMKDLLYDAGTDAYYAFDLNSEFAFRHIFKNGGTTVSRQLIDGHDRVGHGRHVTSEEFHKSKRNLIAVVRDPIDHFLSGWGECGNRFPGRKAKFNTTLPYDERVKNWLVYVKDYCPFGGNTLCACKRHSYPQANFLLTNDSNGTWALHPRLEIVGDLRELKEVLSFVGLKYNEDIEPGRNASKSETKQRLFPREKGLISDTTMIELCQFLALDYLLFDFEPPDVCQNEIASLLINTSNSGAVKVVTPTPPMVTDRGTEETPETHSKSLNKPKLIIHIGPRKTGTTTIHSAVFNKGGDPDYVKEELSEDNFRVFDIRFRYGQKIIAHLNSLSGSTENSKDGEMDEDLALKMARQAAAGKDLFDQLQKELGDSLHENKHFAFLHETWSSLKPTEEAKKALLTATEGFNVTVVMTYRPLYDYYRSLYLEHRKWNIRNYGGWNEMPKSSNQWCQAPLRDWLPRVWSKYSFGDPLIAYETMAYIFGEDSIKVLELKSDLAAQFVCKGMGADHACKKAQKVGEPKRKNTSDEKTSLLAEEDLIIMAAHKKGMMPTTAREGNCTITNREKYKALLNSYLSLHGLNIKDLPRLCLTEEQLDSVKERSWKAEKLMAPSPRTHESFRKDFEEMLKSGQLCNVDVDAALSNPMIINFISDKERSLQCPEPELD